MTNDHPRRCPFASLFGGARPPGTAAPAKDDTPSLGRRSLLLGLGAAGGTLGLAGTAQAMPQPSAPTVENDGTQDRQPFYGSRQAGVITAQPAAALFVAFDVLATDRDELRRLFQTLTARIAFLTRGGTAPILDDKMPPADSGLLGPQVFPDNLTVTVSLGASLFDERFGLQAERPRDLKPMTHFPNDQIDAALVHGDLLLQVCSNTAETNIHALRDVIRHTPDLLAIRWKMEGFLPPHTIKTLGKDTVRNLLGFKDGTANLDARDDALMDRVVWLGHSRDEPGWTRDGTYQVVRLIRTLVERWDRTALIEQEQIIGRRKDVGAPLGRADEHDDPGYGDDPAGDRIRLDAHIRLANPRTPGSEQNLILRRPFNYSRGLTNAGQLDMGLLFCCFQSSLRDGFEAVQARLNGEPLEEYIKPVGGGFFFVLPGAPAEDRYLGQTLLEGSA